MPSRDPAIIDFDAVLAGDEAIFHEPVDIGVVHLAGAGAIGTHFVRALSTFDVHGTLHVVDPDEVAEGNFNRCDFYETADVGLSKAEQLVARAAPALPGVRLIPHHGRLQELRSSGPWLEQLIVAVDSRRARRALQEELPRDVFDASTSGIEEVVLHFNSRLEPGACLSCLYHEDPSERAHEAHVASVLGVTDDALRAAGGFITADAQDRILVRHPGLRGRTLAGLAFDSLFKELCGAGRLGREDGQAVLAPLAFVSALAGSLLAIEFVRRRRRRTVSAPFNDWRVSPWAQPFRSSWRTIPPRTSCTFCSQVHFVRAAAMIWGEMDGRVRTSRKLWLFLRALAPRVSRAAVLDVPPLPSTRFLIEACCKAA
jgi:molybdopterin/thiamine biosynthesis adenylyltransferase